MRLKRYGVRSKIRDPKLLYALILIHYKTAANADIVIQASVLFAKMKSISLENANYLSLAVWYTRIYSWTMFRLRPNGEGSKLQKNGAIWTFVEMIGGRLAWYRHKKITTITRGSKNIQLTINSDAAVVNGSKVKFDTAPMLISEERCYR